MAERKRPGVTYDPGSYIDGWNMIYNAQSIARYNPLGNYSLYIQMLNYDWNEYQKRLAGTVVTDFQKAIMNKDQLALLVLDLYSLFQVKSYQNMYDKFVAGEITPGLQKILNRQPWYNTDVFNAILDRGGFNEVVLNAVKDGKIDFTPFNDTDDKTADWFLKYRLSPVPVPGYFGRVSDLGKLASPTETTLENSKNRIKADLKEHTITALKKGVKKEILLSMVSEVKARYQELKNTGEKSYYNSVFPYTTKHMAGFVVDVSAEEIFDLRPYVDELREILAPGVEPLKEFYLLVERYIKSYERELKGNTPGVLFKDTPFLMMRNSRESNAIASVSGSMMQIAVQQELALTDESGNTLYNYTAKAPVKSGEVIISVKETPKGGALRPSTEKLHILFDTLFTKSGYREFIFPIDGYMELCKRTPGEITPENRRKFRQKLRQDLQRMQKTTFSANLPGCKPGEIGILNAWLPAPNNCIYVKLESLYCDSLTSRNAGKMQLPKTIFKTNEQNPHLIPIMRALCRNRSDYHNINMEANGGRRAHTISLKTLYEWDLALPRWEKVSKGSRQFKRDIVEPLFNAIKELNKENYITSKYIDRDGIEHTPVSMKNAGIVDILDPEKWLLLYEVVGFKDDPEMIQKAMERAKQREENRIQEAVKRITKATKKKKQ